MTPLRPKEAGGCPRCPGWGRTAALREPRRGDASTCPGHSVGTDGKEACPQTRVTRTHRHTRHARPQVCLRHGGLTVPRRSLPPQPRCRVPASQPRKAGTLSPHPRAPLPAGHCQLVSPGFTGYCLCMLNADSRLSADTQLLRVTTCFLGSGSQHWLALTRTLTVSLGLSIFLIISGSFS